MLLRVGEIGSRELAVRCALYLQFKYVVDSWLVVQSTLFSASEKLKVEGEEREIMNAIKLLPMYKQCFMVSE